MRQRFAFFVFILLFSVCFFLMMYYGEKTFFVKKTAKSEAKKQAYHFVLIPEETDNEYWRIIEKGAREAAEKYNVYLEYLGPKRANMGEHVRILDKEIAGKVDGIMTQGISEDHFTPLINKAMDRGISVVTVDADAPYSRREVYVGTDNYAAGFLAGKALLEDTEGKQVVGIVTGRFDASHQRLRVQGFRDAVEKEKRIEIAGIKESGISKTGAVQATYDLLKEHPDITAFYGTSALDGLGIARVISTMRPNSDPYIITFDTLPENMDLLRDGKIDAIVVQHPYEMGYRAVEMLVELKKGNHPERLQYTESHILRQKDLDQFLKENKGLFGDEDDPD